MIRTLQRALVLSAVVIALVMLIPPTSPLLSSVVRPTADDVTTTVPDAKASPAQSPRARRAAVRARGIIMSGWTAGGKRFGDLVSLIERTELNAVVIDIKDESGEVSWLPSSARARAMGSGRPKMADPRERIRTLRSKDIYVIGRIVVFKDPVLSRARPDLAVIDVKGGVWRDRKGLGWADPYAREVWDYNLELAAEAIALGFDEIQFDYIRFPTDGGTSVWYPHADGRAEFEVIHELMARARRELVPLGAWLSADLFGLTTLVTDDLGVGQKIELIAREVDYLSLMLYPSHYHKPEYGIRDPEKEPYKTIAVSLVDAKRRIAGTNCKLRPWLQDFSLGVHYTPVEVRAQIDAAEDNGVDEWLLWNARNRYSEDALRPADAATPTPARSRRR